MEYIGKNRAVRMRQTPSGAWAVERKVKCPCPDCHNPEHHEWKVYGGSLSRGAAYGIANKALRTAATKEGEG